MRKIIITISLLGVGLVLGAMGYHLLFRLQAETTHESISLSKSSDEPLYWVAPMDPNFRRDKPGKSPMGMDLVPVYADEAGNDDAIVISPAVEQSLGVRTTKVVMAPLNKMLHAVGYVEPDEHLISHIHTYTEGWIKQLHVKTTGETVNKDQVLFDLYSLPLMNAQQEYLAALAAQANPQPNSRYRLDEQTLVDASRKKLLALGVTEEQINELHDKKTLSQRVRVLAPQNGVVSELNIRQGMYVTPQLNIMTIVDLSKVWIIAEFFEQDVNWVKPGLNVTATLPYVPNRDWQGRIDYVYPHLDPTTRTLRVRLVFDNLDGFLKPGMYADIRMQTAGDGHVLVVPTEAVIRTGDETRVICALGEGRYRAVPVKTGLASGDKVEIISGLSEGDQVVTSAQFLLDSEASLKASFSRMDHEPVVEKETTDHDDHTAATKPKAAFGQGQVNRIDLADRVINLTHGPIPDLGWPGMTMDLPVADEVDLENVPQGATIHFQVTQQANQRYLVTIIHVMPSEGKNNSTEASSTPASTSSSESTQPSAHDAHQH